MSEEEKKLKIARLIKETAPAKRKTKETPDAPAAGNAVTVTGSGNIVAGGDVIYSTVPAPRPNVIVQTGVGVIDAKQKADLTAKLKQFLAAQNLMREKKMTIGAGWSAVNTHVGVNSYHEMTPEQYKLALAWIAKQRGILGNMKSAPVKLPKFRTDAITAIKARAKQLGDLHYYMPHIVKVYGVDSLTKLSDRQLQEVRQWLFGQRR